MMVRKQLANAMVAGAENTTGNVLLASFHIIKTKPGIKSASSCFVMATDKKELGVNGSFIFSDCATIPEPTAEQLAEIAEEAAESCRVYLEAEPIVAMLSYSTKGSAKGPLVDKVATAVQLLKTKCPNLQVDGELQLDAAIIGSVGKSKAPGSTVAGKANVLVFPDLQAGNIGYKLVQRIRTAGKRPIPWLQYRGYRRHQRHNFSSSRCVIERMQKISRLMIPNALHASGLI